MVVATLMGAVLCQAQNRVFEESLVGYAFEYPEKWTLKKDVGVSTIEIPLPGGARAIAELSVDQVRSSAVQWQEGQAQIARVRSQEVERQWQDEVLSLPVLLTRIKAGDEKHLLGLLYTERLDKLTFRLTMPADQSEVAEAAWLEAFRSLRVLYGETGQAQVTAPRAVPDVDWTETGMPDGIRTVVDHAGDKASIETPQGWTVTEQDGYLRLASQGLRGTMTLTLHTGTVQDSRKALKDEVTRTLDVFKNVTVRSDLPERRTRNLVWLNVVERQGSSTVGEIVRLHATGYLGGHYWLLEYRAASLEFAKNDRQKVLDLLEYLVIAPPPGLPHRVSGR